MDLGTGLGIDLDATKSPVRASLPNHQINHHTRERGNEENLTKTPLDIPERPKLVSMRSSKGMTGLLLAEIGGSMVELDRQAQGFKEGQHIQPGTIAPMNRGIVFIPSTSASRRRREQRHKRGASLDPGLVRNGTLLSSNATPSRRAAELNFLLGGSSAKVKTGAIGIAPRSATSKNSLPAIALEQANAHSRVIIDLVLESKTVVEGGIIAGCINLRVRPVAKEVKRKQPVYLGQGKVRVVGFEVAPGNTRRHIFYQIAASLADVSETYTSLHVSPPDTEGFAPVHDGSYSIPFALQIPVVNSGGRPKGVMTRRAGAMIKYIAVASFKVLDLMSERQSIAHFYRECEVWPSYDITSILAPAQQPIQTSISKKLFMGGSGELRLVASLNRCTWVAAQECHVRVRISNETRKTVRNIVLALIRTTTIFKSNPTLGMTGGTAEDLDACETETVEKRIAETTLSTGQKGARGYASAKGWWTGVSPGENSTVVHSIVIPPDALTISRSRLLEVEYSVRISLGVGSIAGSSEAAHVTLPIRIINFLSLDPPPSRRTMSVQPSTTRVGLDTPEEVTIDSFRSAVPTATRQAIPQTNGRDYCAQTVATQVPNLNPKCRTDRLEEQMRDGNLTKESKSSVVIDRSESSDSHQDADPNSVNTYSHPARVIGTQGKLTLHDLSNCTGAEDRRDVQVKAPVSAPELKNIDTSLSSVDSGLRSTTNRIGGEGPDRSIAARPQAGRRENMFEPSANMRMREEPRGVESDEEVEIMVGNASAQFDSTEWDGIHQNLWSQSSRRRQGEMPMHSTRERIRRLRFDDDESDEGAVADCSRQASVENAGGNIFASVSVPAMSDIREEYKAEDYLRQSHNTLPTKGKDHRGESTKPWFSLEKFQGRCRSVHRSEETGTENLVLPANEMVLDSPLSEYSTDGTVSPARVISTFSSRQSIANLIRQPDAPFGSRPQVFRMQTAPPELFEPPSDGRISQESPARYRQSIFNKMTYVSPEGNSLRAKIARLEEGVQY